MDRYFFLITCMDIIVLAIMCEIVHLSSALHRRQKIGFWCTFSLVAFISLMEVVTALVNGGAPELRWITIVSNYLGFVLSPLVPIGVAYSIERTHTLRIPFICEAVLMVFTAVSFPFHGVFYVDEQNVFYRGSFYWLYVIAYLSSILYLLFITFRMARVYQNRSKVLVYPIGVFMVFGTAVQVFYPGIHVTWLCVTMLSVLYYIYCNELWQEVDGLTGLLNQKSYLTRTDEISQQVTLIVFDVDDFKSINDRYGHQVGDECLRKIAGCIRAAYAKYGYCYRIGGDEFCVLMQEAERVNACYADFIERLAALREEESWFPMVSIGVAQMQQGGNFLAVKDQADWSMYEFKRMRKQAREK